MKKLLLIFLVLLSLIPASANGHRWMPAELELQSEKPIGKTPEWKKFLYETSTWESWQTPQERIRLMNELARVFRALVNRKLQEQKLERVWEMLQQLTQPESWDVPLIPLKKQQLPPPHR